VSPRRPEAIVRVTNETGRVGSSVARVAGRHVTRMLAVLGASGVEVSVTFVDDWAIRDLNRQYRRKDKPTDVLSFPQHDDPLSLVGKDGGGALLGDIVISVPTALRQAQERDRALSHEVVTLLAHGLLHLFGFDHRTDDEEREMDAFARVLEAAASNKRGLAFDLVPARSRA
jgi:probable rRNA maturation factor